MAKNTTSSDLNDGKKEALEIKLGIKEPKKEEAKKWAEGSIASIKEEIAKLDDRLLNENL